jgi:hypothetical protein
MPFLLPIPSLMGKLMLLNDAGRSMGSIAGTGFVMGDASGYGR